MAVANHKSGQPRPTGYPIPQMGPDVPYKNDVGSNPVLRGWVLALVSKLMASSYYLQLLFWKLNKFDQLKNIQELHEQLEPRHDPTVAPSASTSAASQRKNLPQPRARKDETQYYTCKDYHDAYRTGHITPLAVAETLLPLIERPSGKHSIAFLDSRRAMVLEAARASTKRYQMKKELSAMDGVPISVKDEVDLAGHKRTLGSPIDLTNPMDQTAWCVTRWQAAGAVILGKTNMHQFGLDTSNNNPVTGTPLNPHNPGYYSGGSSGGSAYSVASGLCPISLGVDGGGSIRVPASFCGVYGLKTSHGRVSDRPTRNSGSSIAVTGPIASSIDDLTLGYRVMAQPDPDHRLSAMFPDPVYEAKMFTQSSKVLGLCREWIARSDPEVRSLFDAAVNYMKKCGYETHEIKLPFLPEAQKAHALTIMSEIRSDLSQAEMAKLTPANQLLLNVTGSHATGQDFLFAQRMRDLLMKHLAYLWQQYPGMIFLTPTTPCVGWKITNLKDIEIGGHGVSDSNQTLRTMEYVYLANFTGNPAITCPMGYVGDVPVGLMGMGEWGAEEQLLAFGKESEGLLGNEGVRRPGRKDSWVDVLQLARVA